MSKEKYALIITAYQEFDYLEELCKVYSDYFECYIHVDKKCKNRKEIINRLNQIRNVCAISQYSINWGSYKHILAILSLLRIAINNDVHFFHIISANTVLIKNPKKLEDFIEMNSNKIYMEVKKDVGKSFGEFDYRYSAYFFQHLYDLKGRRKKFWQKIEKLSSAFQRKLKIRTKIKMEYKGYIYCHLPKAAVAYVLNFVSKNPKYIRTLKYCSIGEEFFFQNIIMNSGFASEVVNDNLIYDEWGTRGNPAFLDKTDIDKLRNTKAFFARKVSKAQKEIFEIMREQEGF